MKRLAICSGLLLITLVNPVFSVGEAGAIFLLIAPGARAGGLGEAQVAVTNDAYASYWNPAGLGFLKGQELSLMYVPEWLPGFNLDDMYYSFAAYRKHYPYLGTIGGHIIFLSLGEQTRTDEAANYLGTFSSYMAAFTISYSALLSDNRSFGLNAKVFHQQLTDLGAGAEKGKGYSTDFGFDIGYMHKEFLSQRLDLGLTITNIGPKVSFIDPAQADPQPTNFTLGFNYRLIDEQYNKLNIIYDVDKLEDWKCGLRIFSVGSSIPWHEDGEHGLVTTTYLNQGAWDRDWGGALLYQKKHGEIGAQFPEYNKMVVPDLGRPITKIGSSKVIFSKFSLDSIYLFLRILALIESFIVCLRAKLPRTVNFLFSSSSKIFSNDCQVLSLVFWRFFAPNPSASLAPV